MAIAATATLVQPINLAREIPGGSNCYSIPYSIPLNCAMGFFSFVLCFFLTILGSAPFLAVVNYKPDPMEDFQPCNEACYFIRNFGTKALPASTPKNLNLDYGWTSTIPTFAAVENGRSFSVPSVSEANLLKNPATETNIWKNALGKVIHIYTSLISMWQEPRDWPSSEYVDQTLCETKKVQNKIENHLNTGYTIPIYKIGIVGWTAMKIFHDFALLADVPEKTTLWLGICSWIFQLVATCAAFSWGGAAVEVFIARVSTETNEACFYQLKTLETFTALATPLSLLILTHFKLNSLMLAVVNGDFLHYKAYDVPYRVVRATAADLLTFGLRGDPGFPAAPYQQLTFHDMNKLSKVTKFLLQFHIITVMFVICPFGFGNIFLRMTEVAVSHDFSWDLNLNVMIKWATLLAAGALLMHPAYILFRLLCNSELRKEGERPVWFKAIACITQITVVFVSASTSVVAWEVIQAVCQKGTAGVEQRYEWYLCGVTGGYMGFALFFELTIGVAQKVMDSYTFEKEELDRRFRGTENEGDIPSPKGMLLDGSDRHTSHVEQALEVFSSQPEKVKHLLPPDTESPAQSPALSYARLKASELAAAQMESQRKIKQDGPSMACHCHVM